MSTLTGPAPTSTPVRREERPTAITVGLLYILATVAGVTAAAINAPTDLEAMAGDRAAVLGTALGIVVMQVSVVGVAVMLYPLLVRDGTSTLTRGMATGYLASRLLEGSLYLVSAVVLTAMLTLSERLADPSTDATAAGSIGSVTLAAYEYAHVAAQTAFILGAVLLYWLLYVSGRVPQWLSLWGLASAPLFLVAGFLLPFTDDPNSAIATVLYAPLAVQEMVLAGWLIVRGFRPRTPSPSALTPRRLP